MHWEECQKTGIIYCSDKGTNGEDTVTRTYESMYTEFYVPLLCSNVYYMWKYRTRRITTVNLQKFSYVFVKNVVPQPRGLTLTGNPFLYTYNYWLLQFEKR